MPDQIVPPPGLSSHQGAVLPVHARRGDFVPVVGGRLNVTLPGEVVTTEVEKIVTRDIMLARIKSIVLNKTGHQYKQGGLVAVQRQQGELAEIWVPVDERATQEREERDKAERAAAASAPPQNPEPAPKKRRGRN